MEKKKFFSSARYILLVLSIVCFVFAIFFLKRFVTSHSDSELIPVEPVEVEHRVLFLSSYNPFYFTYIEQVKGLSKGLYPHGIEYDVLYMDAKNYSSKRDIKDFYAFIKSRLENRSDYEAVLLGDDNALLFALFNAVLRTEVSCKDAISLKEVARSVEPNSAGISLRIK